MAKTDPVASRGQYRTPFLDESGKVSQSWTRHFQAQDVAISNLPQYFFQPASVRANTPPNKVGIGSIFYETDTTHVFINDGTTWRQIRP